MSNPTPVEIHTHSTFSDGELTPEALAKKLADAGVERWSLTDHDTCEGSRRAFEAASKHGLEYVNGIEISAYDGASVHILGYGIDLESIQDFTTKRLKLRAERMEQMVANLNERGVTVDHDRVLELAGHGAIGRPHLAKALIERRWAGSIPEAFSRFIGSRCAAYVGTTWPSVEQAIDVIHECGGIAVLAHPGAGRRDHRIPDWIEHGLDGLEVEHPSHDGGAQIKYTALAERLRVLKTASTDYHGPSKMVLPLGKTYLDDASMQALSVYVVKE